MSNKSRFEETVGKIPCNSAFNIKSKYEFLFTTVFNLHLRDNQSSLEEKKIRERTIMFKYPLTDHFRV